MQNKKHLIGELSDIMGVIDEILELNELDLEKIREI